MNRTAYENCLTIARHFGRKADAAPQGSPEQIENNELAQAFADLAGPAPTPEPDPAPASELAPKGPIDPTTGELVAPVPANATATTPTT